MFKKFFNKTPEKNEKRKHKRWDFVQATFYKISNPNSDNKIIECYLNNISLGGLCFDTQNEELKKGDTIKLMYKIGTVLRRDTLQVRYIQKVFNNWRIGCEFEEENLERDEMIIRYIKSMLNNNE